MAVILFVEDAVDLSRVVVRELESAGYDVLHTASGETALHLHRERQPDLVILDWMLPDLDGLEVLRRLRQSSPTPVLMLTARSEEVDRVIGLEVGADDYLTKPFSMREVVARVAALLRRVERARQLVEAGPDRIDVGGLVLHPGARRVEVAAAEVHLTPLEFDLLLCLAGSVGQVLTRERLLAEVWGWDSAGTAATRTVDSHVKALRAKVGADRIRTVHGVGYALEVVS